MPSFRTMLPSAKVWKAPWHNIGLVGFGAKLNSQFQTGNSCTDKGNEGVWLRLLGQNSQSCGNKGGLNKRMLSQETTGHLKTSKALSLWSRFTKLPSYYSSLVLMSTSKILMLVSVWSHPHCVCVHTENSFDEISRRNSWPTNTMTTVPKGMKKKRRYETDNEDEPFHARTPNGFAFSLALTQQKNQTISHIIHKFYFFFFRFFNGAPAQYTSYRACSKDWARYEDHVHV